MTLRIAVCDDSPHVLSSIEGELRSAFLMHDVEVKIDVFSNGAMLLEQAQMDSYDIYFLDISMPYDGIALGKKIREMFEHASIVFISGREELVFDTFSVSPQGFIRKSRFRQEINNVTGELLRDIYRKPAEKITLMSGDRIIYVSPEQIQYIEGQNKNQKVVLSDEEVLVRSTMQRFAAQLEKWCFLQPHKSYLVNSRYIYSIDGLEITMDSGKRIPISRLNVAKCREQFFAIVHTQSND